MASSYTEGKQTTVEWLEEIQPETVIDVGPGCGTYWAILNGQYGTWLGDKKGDFKDYTGKKPVMVGIEAYYPYIKMFKLKEKYDQIWVSDARCFSWSGYEKNQFDLAIFGDVLEHMTPEDALAVFDRASRVAKNIIISIPIINFPQGDIGGNPFEVHVKEDWTHEQMLKVFGSPKKSKAGESIGVYWYD